MSIITLTDRISVSVRAKNNTEKSAQNKATGANIQKALGGSGLNDTDLEEIGNVNSIADEQGNEWIKMEDIIAAGRKMKENGAFGEKTEYSIGNLSVIPISDITIYNDKGYRGPIWSANLTIPYFGSGEMDLYIRPSSFDEVSVANTFVGIAQLVNSNDRRIYFKYPSNVIASSGILVVNPNDNNRSREYGSITNGNAINDSYRNLIIPVTSVYSWNDIYMSGEVITNTSGGSIIDWDAPNAEVERQIKNLHETWDVSDHPGAVTGNGTYVLAGPIEFNDGD